MFNAIKSFIVGGDSSNTNNKQKSNTLKENKPLKSDISNNNLEENKKKTIIKGEKNDFDFSEEYEDDPKQNNSNNQNTNSNTTSSSDDVNNNINEIEHNDIIYNPIQNKDDIDFWRMAHCVYVKNSLININMFNYVPFIKIKKKTEGLFSYIGFGTEEIKEIKYLVGFDEHFIYMINLNKEENKNDNDAMKTIGNHYDINQITNIEVLNETDNNNKNRILINILFVLDNDVNNYISKIKKFYFEKPNALRFLKLLKVYINMYKIKVTFINKVFKDFSFNEKEEKLEKKLDENLKKEENEGIEENNINNQNEEEKKNDNIDENIDNEKKEKKENEEEFTSDNVKDINTEEIKI